MRKGNAQMFFLGWNADYPDPENFLFLLYGPQGAAQDQGENAANYANPEFDRLFERMKNMDNGPERQAIIDRMVRDRARATRPGCGASIPRTTAWRTPGLVNGKPNQMARNGLKYHAHRPGAARARRAREWNRPVLWPVGSVLLALLVALRCPPSSAYRRRERAAARRA